MKTFSPADAALLRQREEALLQIRLGAACLTTPVIDLLRLQHELEVHRIGGRLRLPEFSQHLHRVYPDPDYKARSIPPR